MKLSFRGFTDLKLYKISNFEEEGGAIITDISIYTIIIISMLIAAQRRTKINDCLNMLIKNLRFIKFCLCA